MILAGDVGGTKVDLALYEFTSGQLRVVREEKFAAREFTGLEEVVRKFLDSEAAGTPAANVSAGCFGVPGPVRQGRFKLTNLPWVLDARQLALDLRLDHVYLINDLEANAYGIPELNPEKILTLSRGDSSARGNRGLISAGTGLGEALLVWNGHIHVPIASEGGHSDFAPHNEDQIDLLRYLRQKNSGHVSYERVVSGPGLANIYSFYRDVRKLEEPAWLQERMREEDPNAVIGELGEDGSNELCAKSLDMFISAYGAEAGNLALKILSVGGMYIGGGIAPKMVGKMKDGTFMKAFCSKGRLTDLLEQMPVRIILDEKAALTGAAAYAEARVAEASGHSERAASIVTETST